MKGLMRKIQNTLLPKKIKEKIFATPSGSAQNHLLIKIRKKRKEKKKEIHCILLFVDKVLDVMLKVLQINIFKHFILSIFVLFYCNFYLFIMIII